MKRKIFIYSSICMVLLLIIRLTTACNDDDSPADSSPTFGSPFDPGFRDGKTWRTL
ncbi:MAG: Lipase class 3, triacylglycerol lipase [Candidatus Dadabacteria bacterium]|nr:Lipase class 3, triacylglycerol lipase [Candidatus Dadabacteria bacterium]